jgi:hypothetical protein
VHKHFSNCEDSFRNEPRRKLCLSVESVGNILTARLHALPCGMILSDFVTFTIQLLQSSDLNLAFHRLNECRVTRKRNSLLVIDTWDAKTALSFFSISKVSNVQKIRQNCPVVA